MSAVWLKDITEKQVKSLPKLHLTDVHCSPHAHRVSCTKGIRLVRHVLGKFMLAVLVHHPPPLALNSVRAIFVLTECLEFGLSLEDFR